jgi:hypothetical protein
MKACGYQDAQQMEQGLREVQEATSRQAAHMLAELESALCSAIPTPARRKLLERFGQGEILGSLRYRQQIRAAYAVLAVQRLLARTTEPELTHNEFVDQLSAKKRLEYRVWWTRAQHALRSVLQLRHEQGSLSAPPVESSIDLGGALRDPDVRELLDGPNVGDGGEVRAAEHAVALLLDVSPSTVKSWREELRATRTVGWLQPKSSRPAT